MTDEHRDRKKAKRIAREAMLTMYTGDAIGALAREVVPDAHGEVVKLDTAPERATLLADLAEQRGRLDELVARVLSPDRELPRQR